MSTHSRPDSRIWIAATVTAAEEQLLEDQGSRRKQILRPTNLTTKPPWPRTWIDAARRQPLAEGKRNDPDSSVPAHYAAGSRPADHCGTIGPGAEPEAAPRAAQPAGPVTGA